ncbi:NTF2 fold immunity protein [Treponema zioleckii]|uniref:NTF2 fold immunity protein n=1 Tax=Treponema zioleckii TaxID=331680 RepID=UPI00168B851E|nr:NTF2 fold immunity protein [Treponema zioleckii]
MIFFRKPVFLFLALFSLAGVFADELKQQKKIVPPIFEHDDFIQLDFLTSDNKDLVTDSETAIQIAVAILSGVYGKDKIEKQKPFTAIEHEGFWYVNGSLPGKKGGVAHIKIRKKDGAVMGYIHTK